MLIGKVTYGASGVIATSSNSERKHFRPLSHITYFYPFGMWYLFPDTVLHFTNVLINVACCSHGHSFLNQNYLKIF